MKPLHLTTMFASGMLAISLSMASASTIEITPSEAAQLYGEKTTYSIYRKGKKIGRHTVQIKSASNRIDVSVESVITVKVLKVPVFRFNYTSTEVWQDEKLISVSSSTKTNRDTETATLSSAGSSSQISYNGRQSTVARVDYATNHWNINAVSQNVLFNTVKGSASNVNVARVGEVTLNIAGEEITATHYQYTGDIIAESWYDNNQRWVKLQFAGSDGSSITYLIDSP